MVGPRSLGDLHSHSYHPHEVQVPLEDGLGGEFVLPENGRTGAKGPSEWSWTVKASAESQIPTKLGTNQDHASGEPSSMPQN